MFRSIGINNFRGFENFSTDGFERVNLLTGMNGSGKTSLLEAIFLSMGPTDPALSATIQAMRGYKRQDEAVWGWLFHNGDTTKSIHIQIVDERQRRFELDIRSSAMRQYSAEVAEMSIPVTDTRRPARQELLLDWRGPDSPEQAIQSRAVLEGGRITYDVDDSPDLPLTIFISSGHYPEHYDVRRFSELVESKRDKTVADTIARLNPSISGLQIVLDNGDPSIYADVGLAALIPLPFLGEGVKRTTSFITSIASAPNGCVLIDEIENGIHTSAMRDVWRAIDRASRENNVQIFATTHSWECVQAAHEVFLESEEYPFRLQRLDRIEDKVIAKSYDKDILDLALQSEIEVR